MSFRMDVQISVLCLISMFMISCVLASDSSLKVGFYEETCPKAEEIVKRAVKKAVSQDPGLGAGLIRLHFHDCFVRGCDASVLLNSFQHNPTEKEHYGNYRSLRGFEVIDEAKAKLESSCPKTVSCADILAFAARDSVARLGGINYAVPSGRRDGKVSLKLEGTGNLPPPNYNVSQLKATFEKKGLTLDEMVTLLGAHSIGVTHCKFLSSRLYKFNDTHPQDPSMDPEFAEQLKSMCPKTEGEDSPIVPFDFATPNKLDNAFYVAVEKGRGVLETDQVLMTSPATAKMVRENAKSPHVWAKKFAKAMVRMGGIQVLTGEDGEIRTNCGVMNDLNPANQVQSSMDQAEQYRSSSMDQIDQYRSSMDQTDQYPSSMSRMPFSFPFRLPFWQN